MGNSSLLAILTVVAGCGFSGHGATGDAPLADGAVDGAIDGTIGIDPGIPATGCSGLTPITGGHVVSTIFELRDALANAAVGDVIELEDGTYLLAGTPIVVRVDGVTIRSVTGKTDGVRIDGGGSIGFAIEATQVAIAGLTIVNASLGIKVTAPMTSTHGTRIYGVSFIDNSTGIQINTNAEAASGHYADDGLVACSSIAVTDDQHACFGSVLAIDAPATRGWTVRDNRFSNLSCSQHFVRSVRFHRGSRDLMIIGNTFVNGASNIMLGGQTQIGDPIRDYPDPSSCTGVPQVRGSLACNNVITGVDARDFGGAEAFQEGIALWSACDVTVAHNTVVTPGDGETFSTIEYRFPGTQVALVNNLVQHTAKLRDTAMATSVGEVVYTADPDTTFVDPRTDLHIDPGSPDVHGVAIDAVPAACRTDFDGKARAAVPTSGAYER